MTSEWMKVMLEEIARKKAEAEQARVEEEARAAERTRLEDRPARPHYAKVRRVRPRE
jgi:hypothetical protein